MTALERRAPEKVADDARARAEIAIQKILLDLENETGQEIDVVNVDTRNFASLSVEIFFNDRG